MTLVPTDSNPNWWQRSANGVNDTSDPVNERSWTLCQRDAFGDSRRCNGDTTRQLRPAQQTVDAIWRTTRRQLRRRNDVEIGSGRRRVCDRIGTTSSTNGRRRPTQRHQRQRGCYSTGAIEGSTACQRRRLAVAVKHRFGKCYIDLYIHVHFAVFVSYIRVRLITSCRRIANARLCSCVICVNRGVLIIGGC